jgi:uncharacterized membrane protein
MGTEQVSGILVVSSAMMWLITREFIAFTTVKFAGLTVPHILTLILVLFRRMLKSHSYAEESSLRCWKVWLLMVDAYIVHNI